MIEIQFCRSRCCPVIQKDDFGDIIIMEEFTDNNIYGGSIKMHPDSFKDLIIAAKEGKFDSLL